MRCLDPATGPLNPDRIILCVVNISFYILTYVICEHNNPRSPTQKQKLTFLYSIVERVALYFGSEVTLLSLP